MGKNNGKISPRSCLIITLLRKSGFIDDDIAMALGSVRERVEWPRRELLEKLASQVKSADLSGSTVRCNGCRGRINVIPCLLCSMNGIEPTYRDVRRNYGDEYFAGERRYAG
jgi:hypothetical protein